MSGRDLVVSLIRDAHANCGACAGWDPDPGDPEWTDWRQEHENSIQRQADEVVEAVMGR